MADMDMIPRPTASTLVVGLGNPLLGDDAVGWVVAEQVKRQVEIEGLPVEVDCLAVGGIGLMERCVGYARVILIDAVFSGRQPPGHCYRLSPDDLPTAAVGHLNSTHDTTLPTALALARDLGLPLPQTIRIFGVEAAQVLDFGEALTPGVAAAVPLLVDEVMALLRCPFPEE